MVGERVFYIEYWYVFGPDLVDDSSASDDFINGYQTIYRICFPIVIREPAQHGYATLEITRESLLGQVVLWLWQSKL